VLNRDQQANDQVLKGLGTCSGIGRDDNNEFEELAKGKSKCTRIQETPSEAYYQGASSKSKRISATSDIFFHVMLQTIYIVLGLQTVKRRSQNHRCLD